MLVFSATINSTNDFLVTYEAKDLRRALRDLFEVLNTPVANRSKYLQEELKAFPYTNGSLFAEEIEIPQFTEDLKETLLQNASLDFDWSEISPTIFGAVFESTLNPETRRVEECTIPQLRTFIKLLTHCS